jgi:NDP-sugar pyrophosphorylase family protein
MKNCWKNLKFTDKQFDTQRGYYGKIGDRTVIKNCNIIKDTWIGSDAYLKGANKIKNITINSSSEATTQIGEGCELVNGIIGYGCRVFYGVKAVRFFWGPIHN